MTVLGLVLVLMTPSVPQFAPRGFLQANVYDPVNTVGWVLFGLGFLVASSGLVLWAAQTGRRGVEAAYTAVRNVDLDTTSGRVQQVGQAGAAVAGHVTQLGSQLTSGRAYARQAPMIAAYNDVIAQRLGPGIVHVAPHLGRRGRRDERLAARGDRDGAGVDGRDSADHQLRAGARLPTSCRASSGSRRAGPP